MKKKRIATKSLFTFLSILIVPIYTILFGTIKSPFIYTLSKIGNLFRIGFIIWGIITGLLIVIYVLSIFKKAKYEDEYSKKFLFLSYMFLFMTVLVPALKETLELWYYVHWVVSILFVIFLLISIFLLVLNIYLNQEQESQEISKMI